MHADLKTRIRNALEKNRYELAEGGLLLPHERLTVGGRFDLHVNGVKVAETPNIVTNEGLDTLLDVMFHGGSQITTWYVAPFSGNVTPLATWTAANVTANATEFTNYTESTRQEWTEAAVSGQSVTNTASRAAFTIGVGGGTIYGAFLISASAKSATTGKLFAATRFTSSRAVVETDVLNIGYTITAASA